MFVYVLLWLALFVKSIYWKFDKKDEKIKRSKRVIASFS